MEDVAALHPDAVIVNLPENTGAAGGFHAGLETVLRRTDIAYAVCFDDDAVPRPGCVAALLSAALTLDSVGTVGAMSHDGTGQLAWAMHIVGEPQPAQTVDEVRTLAASRGALPVAGMCWHGLMVPVDVVRRQGNVWKELWLQLEDAEFALRLRRAGLENYLVPEAEVIHPRRPRASELRILGRTISVTQEPPWKEYLTLRNQLVIYHRYNGLRFWLLTGPLILVRGILTVIRLGIPKRVALRSVLWRAVTDAARGRLGPP
jgi:GT2 family glycosyltransferase